VTETQYRH